MRLTRVELYGFKSFADRVQLDLAPGLTAIVGPNGCGKSNVIDAVRWALGEQRVSVLRGDEMLDVVFKGNGARAARNFAEVSLAFDNADGRMPIEYGEVVITRRLFRSGESEYLINKQPVRLKDVRALLMDTGLGTSAYSIMEQGRIDAVLSADPAERRRVFEEAAGISRYRAQRRESESKLERTEQNLLRLGDVVEELEKQVRSLKQQAGRARSWVEVRDRIQAVKAQVFVQRWRELGLELDELAGAMEQGEAAETSSREALVTRRAELALLQERLSSSRADVDRAAEAFHKATSVLEVLEGRRAALAEHQRERRGRAGALQERAAGLEQALAERRAEQVLLGERTQKLEESIRDVDVALRRHEEALAGAEQALAAWRVEDQARREQALSRQAALVQCRNRTAEAGQRRSGVLASRDRLGERLAGLVEQLAAHESRQGQLFAGARDLEVTLESASEHVRDRRQRKDEAAAGVQALDEQLGSAREELAAAEARRAALQELITRREGVSPGAVSLLDAGLPGIEGLLVDHLRAPRGLAEAVEAALGATTQALVVASRADALAALAHLHAHGAGRVLLLPRDTLRPTPSAAGGVRLLDRLAIDGERDLLEALLGHVRLVEEREALLGLVPDGVTVWVTPQGDLLDARGVLRGGHSGPEGGLVARRAECAELGERVGALRAGIEASLQQRQQAMAALVALEGDLQTAEGHVRRIETERERSREEERQVLDRQQALEREAGLLRLDLAGLERELAAVQQELALQGAAEAELAAAVAADHEAAAAAELERERRDRELGLAQQDAGGARTERSTLVERQQAQQTEGRLVARAIEERQTELLACSRERQVLEEQDAGARSEAAELERRQAELAEERDRCAGALGAVREAAAGLHQGLSGAATAVEAAEQRLSGASEALAAQRLAAHERRIHRDSLAERAREELAAEIGGLPAPAEGRPAAELEQELEELKERLARLGNVNLAAIDELTDVEQRLGFLSGQRDDLVAAKAALVETIARANIESRERFVATFEEVRTHFRGIFRKLFQGGRADISLAADVDVLEAGVDIVAAPPGKDSRSISLLSGGERTLTAVGLLFALFRTRPSPVCLLDEVDAALDEANIDRFCSVLEDFLSQSQFLVVTHARRTMSYADTIYGVTMQEHGVSRTLSLTLSEFEQARTRGGAARLAAPPPPVVRRVVTGEPASEEAAAEGASSPLN